MPPPWGPIMRAPADRSLLDVRAFHFVPSALLLAGVCLSTLLFRAGADFASNTFSRPVVYRSKPPVPTGGKNRPHPRGSNFWTQRATLEQAATGSAQRESRAMRSALRAAAAAAAATAALALGVASLGEAAAESSTFIEFRSVKGQLLADGEPFYIKGINWFGFGAFSLLQ